MLCPKNGFKSISLIPWYIIQATWQQSNCGLQTMEAEQGHPSSLATKAIALLHGHQFVTGMIAPFICER